MCRALLSQPNVAEALEGLDLRKIIVQQQWDHRWDRIRGGDSLGIIPYISMHFHTIILYISILLSAILLWEDVGANLMMSSLVFHINVSGTIAVCRFGSIWTIPNFGTTSNMWELTCNS